MWNEPVQTSAMEGGVMGKNVSYNLGACVIEYPIRPPPWVLPLLPVMMLFCISGPPAANREMPPPPLPQLLFEMILPIIRVPLDSRMRDSPAPNSTAARALRVVTDRVSLNQRGCKSDADPASAIASEISGNHVVGDGGGRRDSDTSSFKGRSISMGKRETVQYRTGSFARVKSNH